MESYRIQSELTAHEQHILASDYALTEAANLVVAKVSLQEWPTHLKAAISMAFAQSCDDTRQSSNRINAHRANHLIRFLSRRGIVPVSFEVKMEDQPATVDTEYIMDRLLADLTSRVAAICYKKGTLDEQDKSRCR